MQNNMVVLRGGGIAAWELLFFFKEENYTKNGVKCLKSAFFMIAKNFKKDVPAPPSRLEENMDLKGGECGVMIHIQPLVKIRQHYVTGLLMMDSSTLSLGTSFYQGKPQKSFFCVARPLRGSRRLKAMPIRKITFLAASLTVLKNIHYLFLPATSPYTFLLQRYIYIFSICLG